MPVTLELLWVVVVVTPVGFARFFMGILKHILVTCVELLYTHFGILCALVADVVNKLHPFY